MSTISLRVSAHEALEDRITELEEKGAIVRICTNLTKAFSLGTLSAAGLIFATGGAIGASAAAVPIGLLGAVFYLPQVFREGKKTGQIRPIPFSSTSLVGLLSQANSATRGSIEEEELTNYAYLTPHEKAEYALINYCGENLAPALDKVPPTTRGRVWRRAVELICRSFGDEIKTSPYGLEQHSKSVLFDLVINPEKLKGAIADYQEPAEIAPPSTRRSFPTAAPLPAEEDDFIEDAWGAAIAPTQIQRPQPPQSFSEPTFIEEPIDRAIEIPAQVEVPQERQAIVRSFSSVAAISPPPDGASLIEASALSEINKYPVILVVATPGNGKTETMRHVLSKLDGIKVFCSHKAEKFDSGLFDLCFGYNHHNGKSAWRGDDTTTALLDHRDLSWIEKNEDGVGTVADFYWASYREIRNRQEQGETRVKNMPLYRCFADEVSFAYTALFKDALNPKLVDWGRNLISTANSTTFMDGRSHRCQMFYAAQSESVSTIGLEGLSKLRNDMWHLYPGRSAIAAASRHKKQGLVGWLQQRVSQGYGIALLEKDGQFFEVLNLPLIKDLNPKIVGAEPTLQAPQSSGVHPTYKLIADAG